LDDGLFHQQTLFIGLELRKRFEEFKLRPAVFVQTVESIITERFQYPADCNVQKVELVVLFETPFPFSQFLNSDEEQDRVQIRCFSVCEVIRKKYFDLLPFFSG